MNNKGSYYIPDYKLHAEGTTLFGGYGPRLFNWRGLNQFENVVTILRRKPQSRQAVVQLFDANDLLVPHKDVPCTCTLQFMLRRNHLQMITHMRSNDAYVGLPHDIFCFTMIQEIIARTLSANLGRYKHMVGSLHLYTKNEEMATRFLQEGWQPTQNVMEPMPEGNPQAAIDLVLAAERAIRIKGQFDSNTLDTIPSYWSDLIRLLLVFRAYKDHNLKKISHLKGEMSSEVYHPYITRLHNRLT